ncbi:MAG TPA: FlgD immunoglobulin-like domain containing protein [Candidatus Eisenbacteria bacterium]|nr:FlgD immunoglobulin-like domain containing protein [Candidatus Eisenbacteria bacterium]
MKSTSRRSPSVLALLAFLVGGIFAPEVAVAGGKPVMIVPMDAKYGGKSYQQWSDAWWQWALGVPADVNPLFDETGENALQGQSGNVYFLAGVFNVSGQAERSVIVPPGKALFFPILNVEWDNLCPPLDPQPAPGDLVNVLEANVTAFLDAVDRLECELDGVEVPDMFQYRVGPGDPFSLTIPPGNVYEAFGCPWATAGTYSPFVSGGYYLLMTPLPAGPHTLHFTGHTTFGGSDFTLDITYHILVGNPPTSSGAFLARVAPNPLNPQAKLTFTTRKPGPALVQIFDLNGRLMRTLCDSKSLEAGDHSFVIDGKDQRGGTLPSGILFYRIRAGDESTTGQFVIMK